MQKVQASILAYNVHARREGLVLSARRCKKRQKWAKREWETPVFRLKKGRADILADTKYLCGKRMDALTD